MEDKASRVTSSYNEPGGGVALKEETRKDEQYLRLLADFDNYRRRLDRERTSAALAARRDILLRLLEVIDDFERALPHTAGADGALSEGVQAIYRKLLGVLETEGVVPFDSVGKPFDPAVHEAAGYVDGSSSAPDTVAEEVRRGYLWRGELLRPARVLVARGSGNDGRWTRHVQL